MTSFDPATAPVLRLGSTDADWVTYLQQMLTSAGHSCGVADGDFGPATESAVVEFQRQVGLAGSGTVDYETWTAMANGSGASPHQDTGNEWFGEATGSGEGEQHQTHSDDNSSGVAMEYLLPEEESLEAFGINTFLGRDGGYVVATARVTNIAEHLIQNVELQLTLTSGYGRQNSQTSMVGGLAPSESVAVQATLEMVAGDHDYSILTNAVGVGALPVSAASTATIDDYE